ncbi:MAG: heat shock protein DnaJ-like protein [Bacteroidetes bacterium]|nr:MAG: heat shock protein DnaJ-like protein [Bacteroidota bacterium]
MKNPYTILGLEKNQNADRKEIMAAQMKAMKDRLYMLPEIATAARQLLDPAKRLAADFMFPSRIKSKRPQKIVVDIEIKKISLSEIDENAFDSLK